MIKNKLKKLVIFIPSIEDGGVEKNLFLIANFLSKHNFNITVISANYDKKKYFKKKINFISPKNNFLNKKNRFYKTLYCFYLLFKFYIFNKNFLIFSFQANIYAILFCFFFRLDIITRSNTAPPGWSSNKIKRIIFKLFFKYPKKIIVNSLEFKKQLDKEFNINSYCIYNPFDKNNVRKKANKNIFFSFFKKNTHNFINIGRMTDQKDQIIILKAFNKIKNKINFRLIILGKGKNFDFLSKYINLNNLGKFIKLQGYKKNPYPYLKKADTFILSSKFEGLPNVVLEAQFLKKTIISSNCPTGPNEILLNGKAGHLFEVGNENQLIEKILFVCKKKNKEILKRKNLIGLKAMNRFNYLNNMNKYKKIIEKYF